MIKIANKKECCGCGGCANICPKNCITMKADQEGFLYPYIDTEMCINCGLCEKSCPAINCEPEIPFNQKAYLVQNKDEKIRGESTSGGAFSAIAQYVIEQGGVVFGAAFDEHLHVKHVYITETKDLWKFRNSKYVQSETGNSFSMAEKFLKQGRMVCYSGTPCQIEGIKRYLRKEYINLITVDIVCHAVPSPLIWEKYLEMQHETLGKTISNVVFRNKKHFGYKYSTITIEDDRHTEIYSNGIDTDPMLRAFFSNICDRPSCYECCFKKRYRVSDFTLWDCFEVEKFDKSLNDDKGTTRVLVHSNKGVELLNNIKKHIRTIEVDPDKLTMDVKEMFYSVPNNIKRDQFFKDANIKDARELFCLYFPETIKVKLERFARVISNKLGIYTIVKRIYKWIIEPFKH